jgi:GT2 family glycosyltransferase
LTKVAVVILNWNGQKLLEKFLPAVLQYSPAYADIYVADNRSTDQSLDMLQAQFPQVKLIALDKNWGFAAGYNRALEQIQAEYYVLLNSDVEVTAGWIEPIIELLDRSPTIAACQPKIRAYNRKDEFEYAGAAGGFIDKWGYPFCRGRIFHIFEKDEGQYDQITEIFWASGASLFIRAEVYHAVGGLDEDFFAHMEEIDLCWRIKNIGYQVYFHPGSLVYHVGGGTLLMGSPRKTFLNFRNNLQLMSKNLPKRSFLPLLFLRMILDGVAAISFLPYKNGIGNFFAVPRAHFSYYSMFFKIMKKRKNVPNRKVGRIYKKSVVVDFFLRKKRKFSDMEGEFTK